jgi:hypothetical protein
VSHAGSVNRAISATSSRGKHPLAPGTVTTAEKPTWSDRDGLAKQPVGYRGCNHCAGPAFYFPDFEESHDCTNRWVRAEDTVREQFLMIQEWLDMLAAYERGSARACRCWSQKRMPVFWPPTSE